MLGREQGSVVSWGLECWLWFVGWVSGGRGAGLVCHCVNV